MIRTTILSSFVTLFCASTLLGQGVTGSVNDDGFIVLSGDNVELFGVDLKSELGLLVPIADDEGSPFGFLLKNIPTQITYGSLNSSVILQGDLVLSAKYDGEGFGDDLTGQWGGPELDGPIAFPTSPPDPDPVDPDPIDPDPVDPGPVDPNPNPVIPEPNTGFLALVGVFGCALLRRRKR